MVRMPENNHKAPYVQTMLTYHYDNVMYGKQYGIRIESREGDGTTVIISVPVEEK